MTNPRKIALFGGTFDPVHLGHIHLAKLVKNTLDLDEVRFLPCRISPHKTGTQPASGENRCEMLRLATADLPWAVVDDLELHQSGPNYSYQTAEAMAARFPHSPLFWIMGGDQWESLPRWKNPERLAELVEFVVLARGEPIEPHESYRLHVVDGQHHASATKIREAIESGKSTHPWLDARVAAWIARRKLYHP